MSTHNICFYGEIIKIIPQLSPNTHLICSTDVCYNFSQYGWNSEASDQGSQFYHDYGKEEGLQVFIVHGRIQDFWIGGSN